MPSASESRCGAVASGRSVDVGRVGIPSRTASRAARSLGRLGAEGPEAARPFHPEIKPLDAYAAAILDTIDIDPDEAARIGK